MNPLEREAGMAEAFLDLSGTRARAGRANVSAIVERQGASILLRATVEVVGPTAVNGLDLTLLPAHVEVGESIHATVAATDSNGVPVVDGTVVYLTCEHGGSFFDLRPGADGAHTDVVTTNGTASTVIEATAVGIHRVTAHVLVPDPNGELRPSAVSTTTFEVDPAG
jgi:hypothetical protein